MPGKLKFGKASNLKSRLTNYNMASFGKGCEYVETWDVPPGSDDKAHMHALREVATDWDGFEWFEVDEDAAIEAVDRLVDELWEKHDPEFVARTIEAHEIDDIDWEMVEIDQLSPEAADLILERFKAA
jgi:hypothetical protein